MDGTMDLTGKTELELRAMEREIAKQHLDKFPYLSLAWGLGNLVCWLSVWVLCLNGILPLWAGFIIATINIAASYLPSHEAQHSIFAMPGKSKRWLNELVGHLSPIPLVMPFSVLRATHMEHHKHANDPELDPDYDHHYDTALGFFWGSLQWRQPQPFGREHPYARCLKRIGREDLLLQSLAYRLVYLGILCAMALNGLAIEAALLWWLPWQIGITYIQFYLSWAPHNPGCGTERYSDTQSFKSRLGNIWSSGMQYHVIHHLYPRIPLVRTPEAYRQMKPILKAQGARVDAI
ncbi:MAG: beta-carotene hydroxylase [Halieaceae bacterium]|jgi:beta-carotene hydroxylase|nr:beta-carotene hydroxylase [Halieaceae bacterium]MBT6180646.1 beta-carotene hydroxylase [Halieaceae bacterium]